MSSQPYGETTHRWGITEQRRFGVQVQKRGSSGSGGGEAEAQQATLPQLEAKLVEVFERSDFGRGPGMGPLEMLAFVEVRRRSTWHCPVLGFSSRF